MSMVVDNQVYDPEMSLFASPTFANPNTKLLCILDPRDDECMGGAFRKR